MPWRAGHPALATNDPSPLATGSIPADLLVLFQQASAASPCGVPWTLLAAVAKTESSFDPTAVSGAGAEGMFQFEPATFAEYAKPTPPGGAVPPTPFDPTDAAYAAARYLCSLGVADNPTLALVAYNCGNPGPACQAASAGYAEQVLATAASYTAPGAGVPSGVQAAAVAYAESQIGTPYVYGGDDPQTGFDCSGLVVWAYGLAGVVVPRVANDQWHDEPHVALDAWSRAISCSSAAVTMPTTSASTSGTAPWSMLPTPAPMSVSTPPPLSLGPPGAAARSCSVLLIRWPPDGVASDVWLSGWGDRPSAPRRERSKRTNVGWILRDSAAEAAEELRDVPEQLSLFDEPPDR